VVFNCNGFSKMKDNSRLRPPKGSHVHRKCGSVKEMVQDRHQCRMAYRFVPSPMTLGDLEGHSPVAGLIKCNSTNICATFCMVSTDAVCRAVPRR